MNRIMKRNSLFLALILSLIICSFPQNVLAKGLNEQTLSNRFVMSKSKVMQDSRVDVLLNPEGFDEVVYSADVMYKLPSGENKSYELTLDEDSGLLQGEIYPSTIGTWTVDAIQLHTSSEPINYDGTEFYMDFIVFDSMEEMYGESISDTYLDDAGLKAQEKLTSEEFNHVLQGIAALDAHGNYKSYDLEVVSKGVSEEFNVYNDGISLTTNETLLKEWSPGRYDIRIVYKGKALLEKTIEIVKTTAQSNYVSLSSLAKEEVQLSNSLSNVGYVDRLWGTSRFDTAVAISKAGFDSANSVVLVNPVDFPDSLAASSFAYAINAPILYTNQQDVPGVTRKEIERLKPENIYLVGGALKISSGLSQSLTKQGYDVQRLSGTSRFDTAIDIASATGKIRSTDMAILVVANNYPDALSAGSYSAKNGVPILYTLKSQLESNTKKFINKNIKNIIVVGGEGVITSSVVNELQKMGKSVTRVGGQNRFETSTNFAKKYFSDVQNVVLTSGFNYPDALAGGVLAARAGAPILLTYQSEFPSSVMEFLNANQANKAIILGGEQAVSDSVFNSLQSLIKTYKDVPVNDTPVAPPAEDPVPPEVKTEEDKPVEEVPSVVRIVEPRKHTNDDPIRIMLDPGHGYRYNKGVVSGYFEGEMTIKLAVYLKKELESYGMKVGITRSEYGKYATPDAVLAREKKYADGSPINNQIYSLASRGAMAKNYDLFLSLHSNAGADVRGTEIFDSVVSPNKALSDRLVAGISQLFDHNNRKTKYKAQDDGYDWYGVLRGSKATHSMLIEHGFHSNSADCSLLMENSFLKKIAVKEASIIAEFYGASK